MTNLSWMGTTNRALAILRVSSVRQKEGVSHDVQEKEVRDYCRAHSLDLTSVERISESAKAGADRKKYKAIINLALKSGIRHILFHMFDRETRNLKDNEANEELVKTDRLVIHYVRDSKVIHKGSSDSDFFMRDIQAATNKQFIRNLSAKVNDAMKAKAEAGWYPSNNLPLGYYPEQTKDADGRPRARNRIVGVDPFEQKVRQVQREYELRAQGLSYEQIRETIIAEGFIPSSKVSRYYVATIAERLKNPFYRGRFTWQGKVYEGSHELIIPAKVLAAVDATFGNKRPTRRIPDQTKDGVFAGGWLKCGDPTCGCHVVYDPKTRVGKDGSQKTHHYYHCTDGKRVHQTLRGMAVPEEKIWDQLGQAIEQIAIHEDFGKQIAEALNQSRFKAQKAIRREMEQYRGAVQDLEAKEDQATAFFVDKLIDEEAYRRRLQSIRAEKARFTTLLEKANLAINDASHETAQSILELAISAKDQWVSKSPMEKRALLEKILSNVVLDGGTVRYEIRKPFMVLTGFKQNSQWRARLESNQRPSASEADTLSN